MTVDERNRRRLLLRAGDPNLANVPAGGTLWTFKLFED